jgi:hypothetical protein
MNYNRFVLTVVTLLLCLLACDQLSAQSNILERKVSLVCHQCTREDVLLLLYQQENIHVNFVNDHFDGCSRISVDSSDATVGAIVRKVTTGCRKLEIKISDDEIKLKLTEYNISFSGLVLDKETNEPLIGATVAVRHKDAPVKIYTDQNGRFAQRCRNGKIVVSVTYPGYDTATLTLNATKDIYQKIKIAPRISSLGSVEILKNVANSLSVIYANGGTQMVPDQSIRDLPNLLGQEDIFRASSNLPGIQTGVDGLSGFHVRGGNSDQNLILLDNVPVYGPTHAGGLVSVFNSSLIKHAKIWKGDFPARFGGRTSAVVDIHTRDGSSKQFGVKGSVSGLMSSLLVEGPVMKGRGVFIASLRHSVFSPWLRRIRRDSGLLNVNFGDALAYNVYDYNAKFKYRLTEHDDLFLSFYSGGDDIMAPFQQSVTVSKGTYHDDYDWKSTWGNTLGALRWSRRWTGNLFSNTVLSTSRFKYRSALSKYSEFADASGRPPFVVANFDQRFITDINDYTFRSDFTWVANDKAVLRFGCSATSHQFTPGALSFNLKLAGQSEQLIDSLESALLQNNALRAKEYETYASLEYQFPWQFFVNAGINATKFDIRATTYRALLPRLRLFHGSEDSGFRQWFSLNYMAQYLHQAGSFNIGLPFELWVPSTEKVLPERARQMAIGMGWNNKNWGVTLEAYHKNMDRVVVLESALDGLVSAGSGDATGWEERMAAGKGNAKGIELLVEKKKGANRGFLSYTLSRSMRQFDEINNGKPFLHLFDRPHELKINYSRHLLPWLNCSATWLFASGTPITLSGVKYFDEPTGREIIYYSDVNGFRLPVNHRLDLAVNLDYTTNPIRLIRSRPIRHALHLGVYNAYNRANPFYLTMDNSSGQKNKAIAYTLFPVMPSFRYEMTF